MGEIFFDNRVQAIYPGQVAEIQWHKTYCLLAAASFSETSGATVTVFGEEGEAYPESVQRRTKLCTALAWHPTRKILAAGWETGEVTVRNEQENESYDVPSAHKCEVTVIQWSGSGSRVITADLGGTVVIWRVDAKGRLQQNFINHQTLGEQITHCVLAPLPPIDPANDLVSLARAAVSGDESALDMFTWQKGRVVNPKHSAAAMGLQEPINFFIGDSKGGVYYINDNGKALKQFSADGAISKLLFYDDKYTLVTVTTNLMLTLHGVGVEGELKEIRRGKLSGRADKAEVIWTGRGILATCTGEKIIRMWDLDKDENYILTIDDVVAVDPSDTIDCIAFCQAKGVLAGGTSTGKIFLWKFSPMLGDSLGRDESSEECWKIQAPSSVSGLVSDIAFGTAKNLLAVSTIETIYILNEQPASTHCCAGTVAVQTGSMKLSVDLFSFAEHYDLKTDIQVKAVYCTKDAIAVTDGRMMVVYESVTAVTATDVSMGAPLTSNSPGGGLRAVGSFRCSTTHLAMYEQNIYTLEPGKIQVRNFQGTVKQLLPLPDPEDEVLCLEVCSQYLVLATAAGAIKLFDLSRREAKSHAGPKYVQSSIDEFSRIINVKCNCTGSKVSFTIFKTDSTIDSRLYIWDIEVDAIRYFDLRTGRDDESQFNQSDQRTSSATPTSTPSTTPIGGKSGKKEVAKNSSGKNPSGKSTPGKESGGRDSAGRQGGDSRASGDLSFAERGKEEAARDISGRYPLNHCWDWEEPKLLVCEAKYLHLIGQAAAANSHSNQSGGEGVWSRRASEGNTVSLTTATMKESIEVMVVSMFVTPDNGILVQDSFALPSTTANLLALEIPYYYFSKKNDNLGVAGETKTLSVSSEASEGGVLRRVHRDFVGLEGADRGAKDAMMSFSFYLTQGDMDEAFKAIKVIKSDSVWENMAKMCVKTRRLDVARVCLGSMSHARGAMMLRRAAAMSQTGPAGSEAGAQELDAQVAVLAIQLGLYEDAERLLKNCRRYDLLNQLYQTLAKWDKAMETAQKYDRIHLRSTCYNYAKYLESVGGQTGRAIQLFERSGTQGFEVPRMLFDEPGALEDYISKTEDKSMLRWWAQYMESSADMEEALKFYKAASDHLSLVRIYCYTNKIQQAVGVCNETNDKAACYHVARQYENEGKVSEAIDFFTRAHAYGNAIRLCKENGLDNQLINMALLGEPEDMVEAARYYEYRHGQQDKAVMLYHKAGYFSKALELAFNTKQFSALQLISESLDDRTDPQLLQRCADFFIDNSQYDRAVDLLAAAKRYREAVKICMEQHVEMSETLVEKLSPDKDMDLTERNKILEALGEICMSQSQYHLATKKFTQSGNRVKAMKALLKSGDTEKITFFATVSRQKEIYVMAAHYLQSLDWQKDPEIMKNIINFYTKGRAIEPLAGFYDACAQVEIDEFQNYEKAMGALGEAYKCLSKASASNETQVQTKLSDIKERMMLANKFIKIKDSYSSDPEGAVKQCQALLQEQNVNRAVRIGDIYGLMAEHFAKGQKWKAAYNCIEEMRTRVPHVTLSYHIDQRTLENIHKALNLPFIDRTTPHRAGPGGEGDNEVMEEEIE